MQILPTSRSSVAGRHSIGVLYVKNMARLRDSLLNDSGDAEVDLAFAKMIRVSVL